MVAEMVMLGGYAESGTEGDAQEKEQVRVAKAVYIELVQVLRRKVAFPPPGSGWSKGELLLLIFLARYS